MLTWRLLTLGITVWFLVASGLAAAAPWAIERLEPPENGFYSKKLNVGGIPIKGHAAVSDEAMREAAARITRLLHNMPQAWSNLAAAGAELHLIGKDQSMVDLPDYAEWKGKKFEGDLSLDQRARGLGGLVASCGEDNLLSLPSDHYRDHRDICSHEFAHTLMEYGLGQEVWRRIREQYRRSTDQGLWKTMYAATNEKEFFAELTMWYFGTRGDYGKHRPPPRPGREWLAQYDPGAFKLLDDLYSGRIPVPEVRGRQLDLLPPAREKNLRSQSSAEPTSIAAHNLRAGRVEVYWLDFSGHRKKYGEINPGGRWSMSTFATHPWVFVDELGAVIGVAVAETSPGQVELR